MAKARQIVQIPEFLTVRELAETLEVSPIEVMKVLIRNGIMATINQSIDFDTAAIVAGEFDAEVQPFADETEAVEEDENTPLWRRVYADEDQRKLERRPPVVTILGHVDHGKTTLLDTIRNAHVAEGEAGGITQHIGAYQVSLDGRKLTFLDTPGHAAFTAMRARGAQGADVAILVVAADDGVMETTKEAIDHARAAKVPIVVAITKTDKRNANPDRVKQELSDLGLTPDEWGGKTMVIPVSAKEGTGVEDLLEAVLLTSEEYPIVANPKGKVAGTILESEMDKSKGILATLLVQNGTLKLGDVVLSGTSYGRIRAMFDERGKPLQAAPPSTPARVMGLTEMPPVGEMFGLAKNEKEARIVVEERKQEAVAARIQPARALTLDDLYKQYQEGNVKELNIILKADVQGSLEPIITGLNNLKVDPIAVKVLLSGIGNITENDVNLAVAAGAIVIGFNVETDNAGQRVAESNGIDIRYYGIIYELFDDIEKALKGMLDPVYADKVIGTAEVKALFKVQGSTIAGCVVREGEIRRNAKTRVRRGRDFVVSDTTVASLKRGTEDVREVRAGIECGIRLDGFDGFRVGDMIEFTVRERVS
jgi:translation initiation factor IF-2